MRQIKKASHPTASSGKCRSNRTWVGENAQKPSTRVGVTLWATREEKWRSGKRAMWARTLCSPRQPESRWEHKSQSASLFCQRRTSAGLVRRRDLRRETTCFPHVWSKMISCDSLCIRTRQVSVAEVILKNFSLSGSGSGSRAAGHRHGFQSAQARTKCSDETAVGT